MFQKFHRNQSISLGFRNKRVFAFNAEIQDGCQKWRENDFCEKSPVDFHDTLWVKNFVEIALSRSVSEINTFLHLTQKFKMATKNGGKTIFAKSCEYALQISWGSKSSLKLLYLVLINAFLRFHR